MVNASGRLVSMPIKEKSAEPVGEHIQRRITAPVWIQAKNAAVDGKKYADYRYTKDRAAKKVIYLVEDFEKWLYEIETLPYR